VVLTLEKQEGRRDTGQDKSHSLLAWEIAVSETETSRERESGLI
jgi:hypothetical protein